jgi:hypothetical protein
MINPDDESTDILKYPELFFCLAAPIGVDLGTVARILTNQLKIFRYDASTITAGRGITIE